MEENLITDTPPSISESIESSVTEPNKSNHYSSVGDNPAEAILAFISYAFLVIGISLSVISGILLIIDGYEWDNKVGWIILLGGTFASLIIWASLMIMVNISNNIRRIKHELRALEHNGIQCSSFTSPTR